MKQTKTKALLLALSVGSLLAALFPARAQNANYAYGDLVLGFQLRSGTGSDQTVLINLGNAATAFRDATADFTNIANVGTILNNTFGIGAGNSLQWYENPNLYFGLIGVWSNANPSTTLLNGDPERTIYVSKSRAGVGIEGQKNSTLANISSNTTMNNASNSIMSLQAQFEAATGLQATFATSEANTWEDYNPFSGVNQATAFSSFTGGIQQAFGTGSFGSFSVGAVEGALDLYRIQAVNDLPGQYGEGGAIRAGEYQGSIVIAQDGSVSFLNAVPEPSSYVLLGIGLLAFIILRRRLQPSSR